MKNTHYFSLFFAFIFAFTSLQAQSPDYSLKLKSGDMLPPENAGAFLEDPTPDPAEVFLGRFYRYIQFYSVPSQEKKDELARQGVVLLDYLPHNTFMASIEAEKDLSFLANYGVRSVFEPVAEQKIDPRLKTNDLPSWALRPGNEIEIIISYFEDIDPVFFTRMLESYYIPVVSRYDYSHLVTVRIPVSQLERAADYSMVSWVEPIDPPAEPENYTGRTLHRSNVIASDYGAGRHYDGTGVVVAMGDDGIIGPHIDYTGRTDQSNVSNNSGNHGDHVAGIIYGAGNLDPKGRGNAFGATLWVYSVWNAVNNSPTSYVNPGVRITSTSYGNGCNAGYTSFARTADQQVRQNVGLIHIFSAGNSGGSNCGYGAGAGWGNITGGIKVGKNVMAIGNLNSNDVIAGSSSRGPAHDGRIKPEVCAKGSQVYSTIDVQNYASFTGTSMAAPGVAGNFAQLIHAYRELNGGADPESALIKGMMMNTAEDLGNSGPDFIYGFGRINSFRAVKGLENNNYATQTISQNQTRTHTIPVPAGTQELKVMIYWHDYEATANATTALVNNLNMTLTTPSAQVFNPWVLNTTPNATALNSPATRGVDNLNNMEQVTLNNPASGNYTVTVTAPTVPQGPQKYWVVWQTTNSDVTLTYPNGGEGLVPGETEIVRWDAAGNTGTFNVQYSTNNGTSWNNIATNVSGSARQTNWNVPNITPTGQCLVRVTRSGSTDQSDANFSIIGVPTNLQIQWVCPDSFNLSWAGVSGAIAYETSILGQKYMDSVGTTANTNYVYSIYNSNNTEWVSVKAIGPNGAEGRRAVAIEKQPGTANCPIPLDAELSNILNPSGTLSNCMDLSASSVTVQVRNSGLNSISNIPVGYRVNGGAAVNETVSGTLNSGNVTTYTFSTSLNLSTPGIYTVESWTALSGDGNGNNDTSTTFVTVLNGTLATLPFTEDFETFSLCGTNNDCGATICGLNNGWFNATSGSQDDHDWRTLAGATASSNTGPTQDFNPGTAAGKYVYLEASGNCTFSEAHMYSPCIDLSAAVTPQMTFSRHMYGTNMGVLHVDVLSGSVWSLDVIPAVSGNQGNSWQTATVNLSSFVGDTIIVRFRGVTGNGFESDIAVDDVNIVDLNAPVIADFSATPTVNCPGSVVSFTDLTTQNPTSWTWAISPGTFAYVGGTNANSQNPQVTFSANGNYTVTLTASNGSGTDTETKTNYITIGNGSALPFTEDFESFALCGTTNNCGAEVCGLGNGWTNETNGVTDDIDWRTDEGGTPSTGTGPAQDYNPGTATGNYVYLEASNCFNQRAELVSPCINLAGATTPVLNFAYHMLGTNMGDLHIDVFSGGSWTNDIVTAISGDQGTAWNTASIGLNAFSGNTIKIRFRGITGSAFDSDIALDDIEVINNTNPPVADFSGAPLIPCTGQTVTFTDASTGAPTSWSWSFSPNTVTYVGGTNSSSQSPQVQFTAGGTYSVTLTATNTNGSNTITKTAYVTVGQSAALPFTEDFEGTQFPPVGWTALNPSGTTITWDQRTQVNGPFGILTKTAWTNNYANAQQGTVDELITPLLDLTGGGPYSLTFDLAYTYYAAGFIDSLRIDVSTDCGATWIPTGFQSGGAALATAPVSTANWFPADSTEWVNLNINLSPFSGNDVKVRFLNINGYGNNLFIDNINIYTTAPILPTASFNVQPNPSCTGTPVTITNTSNGGTSHSWNFGSGANPPTGTGNGPFSVVYSTPGPKTVTLIASNANGQDTATQTINILQSATTVFGASSSGNTVSFTNNSTGDNLQYYWNFGDGSNSTQATPTHTYSQPGTYTVCLTSSNTCSFDSVCQLVTVTCPQLSAGFNSSVSLFTANFSNSSSGSGLQYFWDFGDGSTSTATNPSHTYNNPGNYTVCLTAYDSCSSDTVCNTVTISCPQVSAAFGASTNQLAANFTNNSTGSNLQYFWDFGDGSTSTATNPSHTYNSGGTFTVCLTAYNNCTSDTVCNLVTINCPTPTSTFTTSSSGLVVQFSDQSTNSPTSWYWNFGDGNNSTVQSPTHTYSQPGVYTVCLTAQNACGFDSACSLVTVSCPAPAASFSSTTTLTTASFTDASTNAPTSWFWDFGDGSFSTQQNPSHNYNQGGTYTVCLTASSNCGSDTICNTVTINCPTPTSTFGTNANGLSVAFSDLSTNTPTSWYWNFGDGANSTLQNPTHTYSQPGVYTVCLTAQNACGFDSACSLVTVTCPAPTAAFTQTVSTLTAAFIDGSTNSPTSWFWDFGDGSFSNLQNPVHTYNQGGTYTVCLTASSNCGSDTICNTVTISCPTPTSQFNANVNGPSVAFTDLSTNSPTGWFWNFGDGNSSTQQNPTHQYSQPGTYTVCLTAQNACGFDSACSVVMVICNSPSAMFGASSNGLTAVFTDQSTNIPTTWFWDFGDGSFANTQNPTHTYNQSGVYTVCLTATNNCGADTFCTAVTVTCPAPVAVFTASTGNDTVSFKDNSTGASSWSWDFGDGNTSTQQNPVHIYAQSGTYTACLTVTNSCGTDTTCQTINVVISGLDGLLDASLIEVFPNPSQGLFNLRAEGLGAEAEWRVSDELGRVLIQQKGKTSGGKLETHLDIQGMSQGIYLLELTSDGKRHVHKMIVRE